MEATFRKDFKAMRHLFAQIVHFGDVRDESELFHKFLPHMIDLKKLGDKPIPKTNTRGTPIKSAFYYVKTTVPSQIVSNYIRSGLIFFELCSNNAKLNIMFFLSMEIAGGRSALLLRRSFFPMD